MTIDVFPSINTGFLRYAKAKEYMANSEKYKNFNNCFSLSIQDRKEAKISQY